MSIYRSLWLGTLGAVAALAAVPTPANALTSVFNTYAGWASDQALGSTIYEYTCIPNAATGCGGSATNTQVNTIPLGGTQTISNGSSSTAPLYSNVASTFWNGFWPNDLVSGGTYAGDTWDSNYLDSNNNPVTSITLNFSPAIKSAGFVILPLGLGSIPITVSVSGFGGTSAVYSEKDQVVSNALGCSVPSSSTAFSDNGPTPCGFFGFFGGSTTSLTISLTDSASGGGFCTEGQLDRVANSESPCQVAGVGIGDFVDTISPAVPEPSSLALLGAGLVGLGLIRRRLRT